MLRRIGFWALCGFAVALIWALVFYIAGPSNGTYPSQDEVLRYLGHTPLLPVTAPVALLRAVPLRITWYWSGVINAAMYALAGLMFETIRLAIRSGHSRLTH
jgi:hypothetical protein